MAQFDIETDGLTSPDGWPDSCARCGAAGTALVKLPERYAKGVPGARLPFCDRHRTDHADFARRSKIGSLFILLAMPISAALTWVLHPHLAGPNAGDDTARIIATVVFGLMAVLPVGLLLLLWTKTPIRVHAVVGRFATVVAVCQKFRDAVLATFVPSRLPDAPDELTFEVSLYRPKPNTPADTGGLLFGAAVTAGGLFGALVATLGLQLAPAALGLERNSWWYVLAAAAPAAVIGWVGLGPTHLARPISIGMSTIVGLLFAGIVAVVKLITFSPYIWFAVVYSLAPLVALQTLVLHPIIWHGRVRHGLLAGASGAVAPLAYAGAVYAIAKLGSGPQSAALILGPFAVLLLAGVNYDKARTPFCTRCDGWLTKRRIGAFGRSRAVMEPAVAGGEIVSLARETPYQKQAVIGDTELTSYSCENCGERGTVVLELHDCVKGGKQGTTPTLKRVDRYLYPGPALLVVNKLFPPDEGAKAGGGG